MKLDFIAYVEPCGQAGFIGWVDKMKGLVVESDSVEGIKRELILSLRVKIAYDFGLELSKIKGYLTSEVPSGTEVSHDAAEMKREELPLSLAVA